MAFQSQNLVMIGLGVLGDSPPNTIQPPLPDGIHLRWSFRRDLGFPWYGYYLFRRLHRPGEFTCISQQLRNLQLKSGTLSTPILNLLNGRFISNHAIVLTDLFPPPGQIEFDLQDRDYLRFLLPAGTSTYQVQVTVGFLTNGGEENRVCVDFDGLQEDIPNPFTFHELTFLVLDHAGNLWQGPRTGVMGGRVGLNTGFETRIKLPCPASLVSLSLGHQASPLRVIARNAQGEVVDATGMNTNPAVITLRGPEIVEITIHAPQNEAFLFELCYACPQETREKNTIEAQALAGSLPVVTRQLSGLPGQVVTETLSFSSIDAVEFSSGPAVVIDICWAPIDRSVLRGWELVPKFPAPLCLPVANGDYPCLNRPATPAAAEDMAVDRVRYGDPNDWRGDPFSELHDQLEKLVEGGPPPAGEPMAQRKSAIPGVPDNPSGAQDPVMPEQYPLDLVLMGSLNPAIAQMVGLYWVDETADPAQAYDYLILADHSNQFGGSAEKALGWLVSSPDFTGVDGYIVFNQRVAPAPPLDPPANLRAYALPGATLRADDGTLVDASNNAGVRWDLGVFLGFLLPGRAVLYHLWRADLGDSQPASPTPLPSGDYGLLTKEQPILAVDPNLPPGQMVAYPPDWPPFSLPAIDTALPEGWYSYRVNGIDIFGRHSAHSGPARWFQWALPADQPRPWYYQDPPGGDAQVHSYAVGLLDKVAPPPPAAIEAYALDPQDPLLVRDAAYMAWQAGLTQAERESLTGLRLRWQWTFQHMQQAPDADEFRVYYQPGRLNALLGRITAVAPGGGNQSNVETDIPNPQAADAFVDTRLRVGGDSFRVVGSQAGTPLRLTVANIGPGDEIPPPAPASCSVVIPEQDSSGNPHPLHVDYDQTTNWHTRLHVTSIDDYLAESIPPIQSPGGDLLMAKGATAAGALVSLNAEFDLSTVIAGDHYVYLETDAARPDRLYRILSVSDATNSITVDGAPVLSGGTSGWRIGPPLLMRQYEVFLPSSGGSGLPLSPSLAEPIVYAQIGVSTADDKTHTADDPKWSGTTWGDRPGNEGRAGGQITIFRVWRERPPAPVPPPDSEKVFATPADYYGHSFYTFRWQPSPHLKVHIFRAMDEAVFKADWAKRAVASPTISASDEHLFPVELRGADPGLTARRSELASEINQLNTFAHDATGKEQALAYYNGLSNDGLRLLASLPWTEPAFAQITLQPLDPDDPQFANRPGPDNPPDFPIDPSLRIYIDSLPGRATNRYFYRSAYIDGAQNRSEHLSPASPPVYLPNVVPPRAPVLSKALGGDREITLSLISNREPDLAEYRVYRAESAEGARDTRLMTLIHTEAVPAGDPMARPAEVTWIDSPVPGRVMFFYRLVAVDQAGNVSNPSEVLAARAFDESRPPPPTWNAPVPGVGNAVTLSWTSPIADLRCLVQRHIQGATVWENASTWLSRGVYTYDDQNRLSGLQYVYRLRVMDAAGRTNNAYNELTA